MTDRGKTGGVLSIIAGVFGILGLGMCFLMAIFFRYAYSLGDFSSYGTQDLTDASYRLVMIMILGSGFVIGILGVLGIVGGIFGIKRQLWGLALAGAIAGTITFLPVGIIAVIFTAMGFNEFKPVNKPAVAYAPPPPTVDALPVKPDQPSDQIKPQNTGTPQDTGGEPKTSL